jgi:hypothetical protein
VQVKHTDFGVYIIDLVGQCVFKGGQSVSIGTIVLVTIGGFYVASALKLGEGIDSTSIIVIMRIPHEVLAGY